MPRSQSFNNHWGVPLTLARMPRRLRLRRLRDRHEPSRTRSGRWSRWCGRMSPSSRLIAAAHLGNFRNLDEIATAKAEIFEGLEPGGAAHPQPRRSALQAARQAGAARPASSTSIGFGEHAQARLSGSPNASSDADDSDDRRQDRRRRRSRSRIGAPGRHMVQNALAVLGAAASGRRRPRQGGRGARRRCRPESGRGKRHVLRASAGADHA